MSEYPTRSSRRDALKCLAFGGAGTLFALCGGVLCPIDVAFAATGKSRAMTMPTPFFLQISDTHIGFQKEANPDVIGTLNRTIDLVNAMPEKPAFIIHTGDITHLTKPEEFDTAAQLLSRLKVTELHTVPGEHDVIDGTGAAYLERYGRPSKNKGYYSFDHRGIHFIALVNVMNFKPGGLAGLGEEQLDWLRKDLQHRPRSQPVVVFAHIPLWTVYEPWGWGTAESGQIMALLRPFGSVTVLNGHIHQIVQKVEGNITFHTARSTAFPQPAAGNGPGPGPLRVAADQLPRMLGMTSVTIRNHKTSLADTTLA